MYIYFPPFNVVSDYSSDNLRIRLVLHLKDISLKISPWKTVFLKALELYRKKLFISSLMNIEEMFVTCMNKLKHFSFIITLLHVSFSILKFSIE